MHMLCGLRCPYECYYFSIIYFALIYMSVTYESCKSRSVRSHSVNQTWSKCCGKAFFSSTHRPGICYMCIYVIFYFKMIHDRFESVVHLIFHNNKTHIRKSPTQRWLCLMPHSFPYEVIKILNKPEFNHALCNTNFTPAPICQYALLLLRCDTIFPPARVGTSLFLMYFKIVDHCKVG